MPKIPVYERRFEQQSVSLNAPKQNLNAPIEAFGGGNARALQGAGQNINQLGQAMMASAQRMKQEEDETKSLEAYLQYHDAVNVYLQGDGTEGSGAFNRAGGASFGLTKEAKETLEKNLREISGSLGNDAQRQMFSRRAMVLQSESLASVSRHEAKERKAYQAETYKATASKEMDYALLHYTDPEKVNAAIGRAEEALQATARLQGLPPEAEQQLIVGARSDTLKNVALRHVKNGQYDIARVVMDDDRMSGEDRAKVQDALRPAEVADKADALAESMLARGFDKQGAMKHLMDNVQDLDVRRVAKQTFNALYASRKAEQTAARQEAIYRVMDQVDELDGDLAAQYNFVRSLPEGPVKAAATRRYKEYSNFEGLHFRTDPVAYEDLAEKIVYGEVNNPGGLRENEMAAKVSKRDLKNLESLLAGKQKVSDTDLKNVWLVANGIQNDGKVPIKLNNSQKRELFEFKQWATGKVGDTNRADDPTYLQKLADKWHTSGEKRGGGWNYGKNLTYGEALNDPTWLPDLDDTITAQVRAKFQANPALRDAWVRQYGDETLAMRGYYRGMLEAGIGKLAKPTDGKPQLMR
jgi:hypothetical protein